MQLFCKHKNVFFNEYLKKELVEFHKYSYAPFMLLLIHKFHYCISETVASKCCPAGIFCFSM